MSWCKEHAYSQIVTASFLLGNLEPMAKTRMVIGGHMLQAAGARSLR